MTRDARTKPEGKMGPTQSSSQPRAEEQIPKGEFIDVLTNQPVDPARLQVFPVPQEFLRRVLANEPPRLNPEDTKQTAPRGLAVDRIATQPDSSKVRAVPNATGTVIAPSEDTVMIAASRRGRNAGPLTRWAISGKVPSKVKLTFALILGILALILVWAHLENNTLDANSNLEASSVSVAVPLMAPPSLPLPSHVTQESVPSVANSSSRDVATLPSAPPTAHGSSAIREAHGTTAEAPHAEAREQIVASSPPDAKPPQKATDLQPAASATPLLPPNTAPKKKKAWFSEE